MIKKEILFNKHFGTKYEKNLVRSVAHKDYYLDVDCYNCIVLLNKLGFKTLYSCSGTKKDHLTHYYHKSGYIAFRYKYKKLAKILLEQGWYVDYTSVNPLIGLTVYANWFGSKKDEQIRKMWVNLEKTLKNYEKQTTNYN